MDLRYVANKQQIEENVKRPQFASWGTIGSFVLVVLFVFFILFPRAALHQDIFKTAGVSVITEAYLDNLLRIYPDNKDLRLMLASQQISLGEIDKAEATLKPLLNNDDPSIRQEVIWFKFKLLQKQTYSYEEGTADRKSGEEQIKKEIPILAANEHDRNKLLSLARDALSVDDPRAALQIYKKLMTLPDIIVGGWVATAAKTALAAGDYDTASRYYIMAMQQSENIKLKREYYVTAIRSLEMGNMPKKALALADRYYDHSLADTNTLVYLARIAMSAGNPQRADFYVRQLIWIRRHSDKQPAGSRR